MAKMNFDTFLDKIVEAGEAYSATQAADYKFTMLKDTLEPKQGRAGCYIYVNFGGLAGTETGQNIWQHEATYNLDCVAIDRGSSSATADEKTLSRLRYLVGQVLDFILNPNDRDLGMETGDVASLAIKTVTPFPVELVSELGIQGFRIVISAEFSDEATATGNDLETLDVDAPLWGATFNND